LDLKIEPPRLNRKNISAAIAADVKRFYQQIKTDDVFGTHSGNSRHGVALLCGFDTTSLTAQGGQRLHP
jgi:hypothetical protein